MYGSRTLTARELEIVQLVATGNRNRDIGEAIDTTEGTVKNYLRRIYDKTGMSNRVELALWYLAHEKELTGGEGT